MNIQDGSAAVAAALQLRLFWFEIAFCVVRLADFSHSGVAKRFPVVPVELGPGALNDVAGSVAGGLGGGAGVPLDPAAVSGLLGMVGAFAGSPFEDLLAH